MFTNMKRHALNGETMGTRWFVLVYAPATTDIEALEIALAAAVGRVDNQMSTWKLDSDLMRLNATPPGQWISLPPELTFVLAKGLEIGRASGGAFDIGLGDLVNAWGFGPARNAPDPAAIQSCLGRVRSPTHELLELDRASCRARMSAPVQIDLSGIAKGFGVDEMVRVLESFSIENALVGLDGELKALGAKPGGTPWAVAVEKPDYDRRSPMGVVALQNSAIATSGDYRHWVDVGATRLSHTMVLSRGGPVNNAIASVTVLTADCVDADAWATALLVLGESEGAKLAEKNKLEALIVSRTSTGLHKVCVGPVWQESQPKLAMLGTVVSSMLKLGRAEI